jgi:hypothetical protein
MTEELSLLGHASRLPGEPGEAVLESFPNRNAGRDYWIHLDYPEFSSLCPVTGQPLQAADLLPLKTTSAKSRHLAAMSIPGMMTLFQDEWDGLILETYALKQQVCYHDDHLECLLTHCPCSFCHLGGYHAPGAWPRALPA